MGFALAVVYTACGACITGNGICGNHIGADGAAALAAALKENRTLTKLHVGSEYERHVMVAIACAVHWRLFQQHMVLVSQAIALVLTVQQRWQRR
jgi:hypothetical protein